MVEERCKVCGFSKTYDGKKTRVTIDLRGQIVVAQTAGAAKDLQQKAKDAADPNEIHTHHLEVGVRLTLSRPSSGEWAPRGSRGRLRRASGSG
eukprot:3088121-Pyramimonas_sp.AAC.1